MNFIYAEIFVKAPIKIEKDYIQRIPCEVEQMPNKQYLAISTMKINWEEKQIAEIKKEEIPLINNIDQP